MSPSNPIHNDKKDDALDFIFENVLKSGFSTLNKTELDAILFAAVMRYSDEAETTDYKLGMYLQISQQKVRNLKEKVSIKYNIIDSKDAINYFIEKMGFARADGLYIDIPINDIAVKNCIEDILQEQNILMHKQLNPRIFRIRIDDFLELILALELETNNQYATKIEIQEAIMENLKMGNEELRQELISIESVGHINSFEALKKHSTKWVAIDAFTNLSNLFNGFDGFDTIKEIFSRFNA